MRGASPSESLEALKPSEGWPARSTAELGEVAVFLRGEGKPTVPVELAGAPEDQDDDPPPDLSDNYGGRTGAPG